MTAEASEERDERPSWDEEFAQNLVGRIVLVGLTRLDPAGAEIERTQLYGRVVSVDGTSGIMLRLEGQRAGETYNLPPHTQVFHQAQPGTYTLKSTGEVVVDPDFTAAWTIQKPTS